jgi:hypothetical protein
MVKIDLGRSDHPKAVMIQVASMKISLQMGFSYTYRGNFFIYVNEWFLHFGVSMHRQICNELSRLA